MSVVAVVVVGGGISGLRSAQLLVKQGKSVIVLEANDRVGGRTKGEKHLDIQYDIGGQWVGPTQNRMYNLLKEYSIEIVHQFDNGLPYQYLRDKVFKSRTKDIPRAIPLIQLPLIVFTAYYIDKLAWQVPIESPWTAKRAEEWDSYSIESWMRSSWWASTKTIKSTIEVICWALLATETSRVSFLWFLWFVHQAGGIMLLISTHGGAQQDRVCGGAVQLSQKIANDLGDKIYLSSPVSLIKQNNEYNIIQLEDGNIFKAKKIIMATSPAMISRIKFNPPLPACRDALNQGHLMGHVIKTITFYNSPFWINKGYSGEGISDKHIRLTFDASYPEKNVYALVGFFLGDSALEWCDKTKEERKNIVIEHFTTVFGEEAKNSINYMENNWPTEPYIRGAYMSIPPPNILTRVGPAIRNPINNIHFAGTETAIHWSGYMEGALEAAERVSNEILITNDNCKQYNGFNSKRLNRNHAIDYSMGNKFSWKRLAILCVISGGLWVTYKKYNN